MPNCSEPVGLEDAIACYQGCFFKPSRAKENLFREAEEWINSNDDGIFSFNNVCETLGFDPKALRDGLERQTGTPSGFAVALVDGFEVFPFGLLAHDLTFLARYIYKWRDDMLLG